MSQDDIKNEWCLLQEQFDSYEKHSLYIKLVSVLVVSVYLIVGASTYYFIILLLVMWLQDGIWKTFQSRIETRLLVLEEYLSLNKDKNESRGVVAYQFNLQFQQNRPGLVSLVQEYVGQSLRPTVAFPHCFLVLLCLLPM